MKKIIVALCIFVFMTLSGLTLGMGQESASQKPTVVIINLDVKDILSINSLILTGKLYDSINNIGACILLSPNEAYQIFQNKKFKQAKLNDINYLAKVGKVLGVNKIITGSLFKKDDKYVMLLKLFDVKSNLMEKEYVKEFNSPEKLDHALKIITLKLFDMPVFGSIVIDSNVEGAKVYCDGNIFGKSPCVMKNVIMGEHKIKLTNPGYKDCEQVANLDEDNLNISVKMNLKRKSFKVEELTDEKVKQLWKPQSSGTENDLFAIFALDKENAWAVGDLGIVLTTSNGGLTWEKQETKINQRLKSVFFIDKNIGWACGNGNTIIAATDGGKLWTKVDLKKKFEAPFNKIIFTNEKEGFILGGAAELEKDYFKEAGYLSQGLLGIIAKGISDQIYLKDNGCIILYTQDGGKNWEHVESAKSSVYFGRYDMCMSAPNKIITVGANGIFYSDNKGKTWQVQTIGSNKENLICKSLDTICFINEKEGWIGAVEGDGIFELGGPFGKVVILETADSGGTWKIKKLNTRGIIEKIHLFDKDNGWAIGRSIKKGDEAAFILYTSDSWNSFKEVDFYNNVIPQDACFLNSDNGWLVGKKGTIYKYENF